MADDGVHPNAEGYSIWAKHIGTKLSELLIRDQAELRDHRPSRVDAATDGRARNATGDL